MLADILLIILLVLIAMTIDIEKVEVVDSESGEKRLVSVISLSFKNLERRVEKIVDFFKRIINKDKKDN